MFGTITVASGFSVSSAFTLEAPNRGLVLEVPSMTATAIYVQCAPSLAESLQPSRWFPLQRLDGTGAPWAVHSGAGPAFAVIPYVPTPWCRIVCATAQADVRSFGVFELVR